MCFKVRILLFCMFRKLQAVEIYLWVITSAKEIMFSLVFVCLFVCLFVCSLVRLFVC